MNIKKLAVLLLVICMAFMITTSFAISSSKTVTSSKKMSLYLDAGKSGDSSVIKFNVYGIPSGAVVKKVVVDANSNISWSGKGAIVSNRIHVKNSKSGYVSAPWGSLNKTEVTGALVGTPAKGTWYVYYNGTNISNYYYGLKSYQYVKLTVYYNY
ncbi:hypothetical protein PV797_16830 [Clostridiaceae bacterium M8S5]|nr:hypothetical protein PV797_16830 [Clostridiaceae bacterium M8S5]